MKREYTDQEVEIDQKVKREYTDPEVEEVELKVLRVVNTDPEAEVRTEEEARAEAEANTDPEPLLRKKKSSKAKKVQSNQRESITIDMKVKQESHTTLWIDTVAPSEAEETSRRTELAEVTGEKSMKTAQKFLPKLKKVKKSRKAKRS